MDLSLAKVEKTAVGLGACCNCLHTCTVTKTVYTRYLYDVYRGSINHLTSISDTQFAQQVLLLITNQCSRLKCEQIAFWISNVYTVRAHAQLVRIEVDAVLWFFLMTGN